MTLLRQLSCGLLLAALALFAGCGGKNSPGTVSGKVTVGGKPLTMGSVRFAGSSDAHTHLAPIGQDGSFSASLPPGDYRLAVSLAGLAATVDAPPLVGSAPPPAGPPIPEKFQKPETSGWTAKIVAGANPPIALEVP